MEQFIIWIVLLGIGLGFDFLRKNKKSLEDRRDGSEPPQAPGFDAWLRQMPDLPMTAQAAEMAEAEAETQAAEARKAPRKGRIQPPSHEGARVTEPRPEPAPQSAPMAANDDPERQRELAAHYERWRRAIIDAEILRRP